MYNHVHLSKHLSDRMTQDLPKYTSGEIFETMLECQTEKRSKEMSGKMSGHIMGVRMLVRIHARIFARMYRHRDSQEIKQK